MNPAQRAFLGATLRNLTARAEHGAEISVRANGVVSVRLRLAGERAEWLSPDGAPMEHADAASAIDRLLDIAGPEPSLAVDDGQTVTSLEWRGGSLRRTAEEKKPETASTPLWAAGKATHLDPAQSAGLLKAIGLMTPEGEIKAPMRKKFKQVNHFLDLMRPVFRKLEHRKRIAIVDCGCGKSYLGFVLFWYLRRVLKKPGDFFGADVSNRVIEDCRRRAEALDLEEMRFEKAAIREADLPNEPDLVVSLHACDTATDEALARAVALRAAHIAAVPCCQHELKSQVKEIPGYPLTNKHGLFLNRYCDLLTDMMRSLFLEANGYSVTVGEFVSADDTPKNLMIRASRGNPKQKEREREYYEFKNAYTLFPVIDDYLRETAWNADTR